MNHQNLFHLFVDHRHPRNVQVSHYVSHCFRFASKRTDQQLETCFYFVELEDAHWSDVCLVSFSSPLLIWSILSLACHLRFRPQNQSLMSRPLLMQSRASVLRLSALTGDFSTQNLLRSPQNSEVVRTMPFAIISGFLLEKLGYQLVILQRNSLVKFP